jgi:hypothetical protein
MYFGAVLYISGLRCFIKDDIHIGKKSSPHYDTQKDNAAIKAS